MVETTIGVQTLGIGISAFVATLLVAFLFLNAYKENVARAFGWAFALVMLWGWFGFFSALAADAGKMELARDLRIISIIGNTLMATLFTRFAFVYKQEHTPLTKRERYYLEAYIFVGLAIVAFAVSDLLFDMSTIIGEFLLGAATPVRGPVFHAFVAYWYLGGATIAYMMHRRFSKESSSAKRGGIILMTTIMVALITGGFGYLPWYEIYIPIFGTLRALAVPAFAVGAFYAMSTHNIFNFRVAAANVFVFAIWSFLFFRILLNPSFKDSLTDIYLLVALVILGVLLIRSFNKELDTRLLIERTEHEREIEQTKSEFISIAAHQLRTPLSGIRWAFNSLESASGLNEEQRALVKKGSERTVDVVERVNEMLRAAKLTSGSFPITLTRQDIRPMLKESVAMLENAAHAKSLTLDLSVPDSPLMATVDTDKFPIVMQNLIDNAIKYTDTGSVHISADSVGTDVVIAITDTGIGLSMEDKAHLFEKFYRNDTAKRMFTDGSGLGLFIVKKILDAHGGRVEVTSEIGTGTTFTVRVPQQKKS